MKKTIKYALIGIMAIWVFGVFVSFTIMNYRIGKECRDDRGMIVGTIFCPRTSVEKFPITIFLKSFAWPLDLISYYQDQPKAALFLKQYGNWFVVLNVVYAGEEHAPVFDSLEAVGMSEMTQMFIEKSEAL